MSLTKSKVFSYLIIFVSSLLALALIELGLQLIKKNDDWYVTTDANILRNFEFLYDISSLYNSDEDYADVIRDQYGLRDDCNGTENIEILTIGGSTTDQRYVPFKSTFQKIIQEKLRSENPTFGCVSNAGVDGHSTWGHIFAFEKWFPLIPNLQPKYVLLYIGINDADFTRTTPVLGYDILDKKSIKGFLKQSQLVQKLLPIYRHYRYKQLNKERSSAFQGHKQAQFNLNDYIETDLHKDTIYLSEINSLSFKNRLEILLNYIDEMGASPICVTQPHRYVKNINGVLKGIPNILGEEFSGIDYDYSIKEINSIIFQLCSINTLDLYNKDLSDDLFYDGIHTTPLGSREIGNAMATFIIENY
tara:strand:- start:20842 stop:21924 length:1083 start_codon:yes stop_codon:yes gene_type:complete